MGSMKIISLPTVATYARNAVESACEILNIRSWKSGDSRAHFICGRQKQHPTLPSQQPMVSEAALPCLPNHCATPALC